MDKSPQSLNPLVSVLISTYNRANLLVRAIKSVLNQSYYNFELLIVDAASTDETSKVVNSFSDNRIRYIKFDKKINKSQAVNQAISVMKGDYLTILDDDDELIPKMLEMEINALHNTPANIGFVFGKAIVIRNGKIFIFPRRIYPKKADFYKAQLHSTALSLWGTLIKRTCLKKVGLLNEELVLGEDWEFMLRLLKCYDYKYINSIVYKANYNDPGSISHISLDLIKNYSERIRSYKIFLESHFDEIQSFKRILAKLYFRIARNLYNLHKYDSSQQFLRLTFLTNPINFRPILWLLLLKFTKNNLVGSQVSQVFLNKMGNRKFSVLKKIFL